MYMIVPFFNLDAPELADRQVSQASPMIQGAAMARFSSFSYRMMKTMSSI
jgi:hypothetical protein